MPYVLQIRMSTKRGWSGSPRQDMAAGSPGNGSGDKFGDSDDENEIGQVRDQLYEYAANTTIHGIKYTLEKGRAIIER